MPSTLGIVASGSSPAFSPLDLSPQAWYDASDTTTITSSGGAVSQWNDKSGNSRNVTQATAARQPGTGAVTQNGLNVLTFDGGDWLAASTAADWKFLHDGTSYLLAFAIQFGTTANPNANYAAIGTFNTSFTETGIFVFYDDRSSLTRSDQLRHHVANGSGTLSILNAQDNLITPNSFGIQTVLADPDNGTAADRSSVFVNAGSPVKTNTQTQAVSSSNPQFPLHIGVAPNQGGFELAFLVGRVAEIVIVSGANATESNREKLRDYLNSKWAVY